MVSYNRKVLPNGLRVLIHEDHATPMIAVNVLYDVGSRDEDPARTGFAHLFEHLMFGGSMHAPDFDDPVQSAGGENNAFTNADITNFYNLVPAANVETILWLESDRMAHLTVDQKPLDVQKKVVVEEFKETCLNQPYGDMWHHMAKMAYPRHPYRWPTIGKVPEHIADATLDDVRCFYQKFYGPNNAIIVLSGNIDSQRGFDLVDKWFGDLEPTATPKRQLPADPPSASPQSEILHRPVPNPAIYRAYKMCDRLHPDYYAVDLLSDLLANGRSSRFYLNLHKRNTYFSTIDAYISGTIDAGLFIIEGKPMPDVSIDEARSHILAELRKVTHGDIPAYEVEKLKNKSISSLLYSEVSALNKAISLAYFELLGDADLINKEDEAYQAVTAQDIQRVARQLFDDNNSCELIYIPS